MKTLYLHIGTHKTATTSIQKFCTENRELLASKGICYPPSPFHYTRKGKAKNGMFLGTKYINEEGKRDKSVEKERLVMGLAAVNEWFNDFDNILLSDERLWINLYKNNCAVLEHLKSDSERNGYRLRLIIYLRRQDIFIESWWNQMVKMAPDRIESFQRYRNRYKFFDYYEMLDKFEEIAGDGSVIVKRFDDAVKDGGILQDFIKEIGLEFTDEYAVKKEERNQRLAGNTITIKQTINSIDDLTYDDNLFIRQVLTDPALNADYHYPCSEFTDDERAEFMADYEEHNALLAERFIGDGKPLFSDDYSGRQKRTTDNPEYINDIVRAGFYAGILLHRELTENRNSMLENNALISKRLSESQKKQEELNKRLTSLERMVNNMRHPIRWLIAKLTGRTEP